MNRVIRILTLAIVALAMHHNAKAQEQFNALDHLLQRPQVAKKYNDKHLFDHLFIDGGLGFNLMGTHNYRVGPMMEMNIGDWISPEHGVRLNIGAGAYRIGNKKVKFADLGIDYMINVTAIAQPGQYYTQRPLELYAIAGLDLAATHHIGNTRFGMGGHVALRGQLALCRYAYAYIEPKFSLLADQLSFTDTWHGYRPVGSVSLGLGYRLPDVRRSYKDEYRGQHSFANGLFAQMMAGRMFVANSRMRSWNDYAGWTASAGIGKWMDPYNAIRLSLTMSTNKPYKQHRMKAIGTHLDYMLNLNNVFGGINPERRFWVNMLAGVSYNRSTALNNDINASWGFGGGLQANLRLTRGLNFIIEPRVDIYTENFAPGYNSMRELDVVPSLQAGLSYTLHDSYRLAHGNDNGNEKNCSSIGIAGGMQVPSTLMKEWPHYAGMARLTYTQWHRNAMGWRVGMQAMMRRRVGMRRLAEAMATADWLTDLTALSYGTDNTRLLSLHTVVGAGIGADFGSAQTKLAADVHGGVQAALRINRTVGVTIEPLLGYKLGKRYEHRNWHRVTPQFTLGLDYTLQRRHNTNNDLKQRPAKQHFVEAQVGVGGYSGNYGERAGLSEKLTYNVQVGYGHWFNNLHGVHAAVGNTFIGRNGNDRNENLTKVSASYMLNLKSAIIGESTDDHTFQLNGRIGAVMGISSGNDRPTQVAPGVTAAMQLGMGVTKNIDVYIEPSATIFTKKIEPVHYKHPAEGELMLSIGARYNF